MKTIFHPASSRGQANHGWLKSHHSFSFANYYDPSRMGFGVLRVLNDDHVEGGQGFGTHPHENIEIISLPLEGDLEHKDSMGHATRIKEGEIQVMSAGTGVTHSEYNPNLNKPVKFLQIWIIPTKGNLEPRYQQMEIAPVLTENKLCQILSPNADDEGVWIHQKAWFYMGKFTESTSNTYTLNAPGNGVYAFVLKGQIKIDNQRLGQRDALGIWDTDKVDFLAEPGLEVLWMEVPMTN